MTVTADGIVLKPSMAFDERGHHQNEMSYGVFGRREDGARPDGFIPVSADFMGEGGSLLWPRALADEKMSDHEVWKKPGYSTEGYECAGVIRFEEMTLKPGGVMQLLSGAQLYGRGKGVPGEGKGGSRV